MERSGDQRQACFIMTQKKSNHVGGDLHVLSIDCFLLSLARSIDGAAALLSAALGSLPVHTQYLVQSNSTCSQA